MTIHEYLSNQNIVCYQVWQTFYEGNILVKEQTGFMDAKSYDPLYLGFFIGNTRMSCWPIVVWKIKKWKRRKGLKMKPTHRYAGLKRQKKHRN